MDSQIVAIYCLCDDILKGLNYTEDKQRQMSDAETWKRGGSYSENVGEKSFHRRQHQIAELYLVVFELLGEW